MDIQQILNDFKSRYGDAWPEALMDRFVYLASRTYMTDKEETEYIAINAWMLDRIRPSLALVESM